MTKWLLLDEHYGAEIARRLRAAGYDAVAVVEEADLRALGDADLFSHAAVATRRIVTENIKDFRPLLLRAYDRGEAIAPLLLVSPRRFPRGTGDRTQVIVAAISAWLDRPDVAERPDEDWLL